MSRQALACFFSPGIYAGEREHQFLERHHSPFVFDQVIKNIELGTSQLNRLLAKARFTPVAQAVHQAYAMAKNAGLGEQYVPTMVDVLGKWNEKGK